MYTIKEIELKKASDYYTSAKNITTDPVDYCLPGSFIDKPQTANIGLCPSLMAKRCGANWDEKCSLYLKSLDNDVVKVRSFFRSMSSKKYCRLSDNSDCVVNCQPFDPVDGNSFSVCDNFGSESLKDVSETVDIGLSRPVVVSPYYMGKCRQTCDVIKPENFENDDVMLDYCLKYGVCNDILSSICVSNKDSVDKISNVKLRDYCNLLFTDRSGDKKQTSGGEKYRATSGDTNNQNEKVESLSGGEKSSCPSTTNTKKKWKVKHYLFLFFILLIVCILFYMYYGSKKDTKKTK